MNSVRMPLTPQFQAVRFGQDPRIQKFKVLPTVLEQCGISMTDPVLSIGFGTENHTISLTAPSETNLAALRLQLLQNPTKFETLSNGNIAWKGQLINQKPVELELGISQSPGGMCGGIGNGLGLG